MVKTLRILLLSASLLFIIPGAWPAFADQHQGKLESICIGDNCGGSTATYKFYCDFARAHPTDTDADAANEVCTLRQNYSDYAYARQYSGPDDGSPCGVITDIGNMS